jgi:hypothetical protein
MTPGLPTGSHSIALRWYTERSKRERMAKQEATERNYMPTALSPRRRRDGPGAKVLPFPLSA